MLDDMPNGDNTLGLWMYHAAEDYIAARCCLLNGLIPGFILAEQCIEKLFKAYLRISIPKWERKTSKTFSRVLKDVTASHDLVAYANEIDKNYPALHLVANFESLLTRLARRFEAKYPDAPASLTDTSSSSREVEELDELAILLFTKVKLPSDIKVRSGIYPFLWHFIKPQRAQLIGSRWLLAHNGPLSAKLPMLLQEIQESPVFNNSVAAYRNNQAAL